MTAYRYHAVDIRGRSRRGSLEADSPRAARSLLRAEGLIGLRLEPASTGMQQMAGRRGLGLREQALFTRQLASLLVSGLPLGEALAVLGEQAEREPVRRQLAAIRSEVLAGHGLAESLRSGGQAFPGLYCAVVAAGEQSGQLGEVMLRLADYLESRDGLRQKVILAFVYPLVVSVVALIIVVFLLSYVVPQVVHVFADSRQSLPWLTVAMMLLSSAIRHGWPLILCGSLLTAVAGRWLLKQPRWRHLLDGWLLLLPLLGGLVRAYHTVRFASTLAILRSAGVSILGALDAAGATIGNRPMRQAVEGVIDHVREGQTLSRALAGSRLFPPVLVHMIRAGESTGQVAEMLERAARGLSAELERRTLMLTSMLEPLLILLMGGVVLLIVLAVMLPIIELNTLVH